MVQAGPLPAELAVLFLLNKVVSEVRRSKYDRERKPSRNKMARESTSAALRLVFLILAALVITKTGSYEISLVLDCGRSKDGVLLPSDLS